jgi:RNA polymerase sigma factor (sigma-70 family)
MIDAEAPVERERAPGSARAEPMGDGDLLGRFVADGDESAFASLVTRHGPMVLRVCRRVLGHAHDAEDAFQATFLVLAKKAGRIAHGASIRSWLYGVAYRVSLRARKTVSRHQTHQTVEVEPASFDQPSAAAEDELRAVLDEELLESREDGRVARWNFSFAAACVWELHAKHGDQEVWSRPKWHHQDTDTVYGLVGPFAVDPKLATGR